MIDKYRPPPKSLSLQGTLI